MTAVFGLLFLAGMVAAISLGTAFLLEINAPNMSLKKRSVVSALCGGILALALPLFAVLTSVTTSAPTWIPVVALVVMGITFALLVGFPTAYLFAKRRENQKGGPIRAETFD